MTEPNAHAHYHDPSDREYIRALKEHTPGALAAFAAFDDAALRAPDRAIPRKYTELMALAVGLTTQCVYCIDGHVAAAKAEGATQQEVAETVFVTAALRAGGGMAHGLMALKLYDGAGAG
ncbi:MAG: carboxymuconolactone decarboxylase family protein [Jatrophihabitans sp.]